jgi:hypothetical protein
MTYPTTDIPKDLTARRIRVGRGLGVTSTKGVIS